MALNIEKFAHNYANLADYGSLLWTSAYAYILAVGLVVNTEVRICIYRYFYLLYATAVFV
ncbi:MAG: hypothetical protein ACJA0G_000648 [Kangiellaceae bacterium]|jgi:hypothetical protein